MARRYSREYKEEIRRLTVEDGLSPRVVAGQFGLHFIMLYRWNWQTLMVQSPFGTINVSSNILS